MLYRVHSDFLLCFMFNFFGSFAVSPCLTRYHCTNKLGCSVFLVNKKNQVKKHIWLTILDNNWSLNPVALGSILKKFDITFNILCVTVSVCNVSRRGGSL